MRDIKSFAVPLGSLLAIAALIGVYQFVTVGREKDEEIALLNAQIVNAQEASASGTSAGNYVDGVYKGEADGFGGKISVSVSVENGQISDITVLSHDGEDGTYYSMAEKIIPTIIEQQSADVDTISGATFSSTGIKNAVAEALELAQ